MIWLFGLLLLSPFSPIRASVVPPVAVEVERAADEEVQIARRLLTTLGEQLKSVQVVRSQYRQERTTELLDEPVVSKGVLYLRRSPGCVLFHASEPRESWIRSDATTHQTYDPKRKRAQRLVFQSNSAAKAILSAFFGDFDALDQVFDIAGCATAGKRRTVRLIPRTDDLKQHLRELRLEFDVERAALQGLAYTGARGDDVAIAFESVELDPKIERMNALFDIALPPDVVISERRVGATR